MMVPISSQSKTKDFKSCGEIANQIDDKLDLYKIAFDGRGKAYAKENTELADVMDDLMDDELTTASKWATIYTAKCK